MNAQYVLDVLWNPWVILIVGGLLALLVDVMLWAAARHRWAALRSEQDLARAALEQEMMEKRAEDLRNDKDWLEYNRAAQNVPWTENHSAAGMQNAPLNAAGTQNAPWPQTGKAWHYLRNRHASWPWNEDYIWPSK